MNKPLLNTLSQSSRESEKLPKVMLFDLDLGGHHGSYIQHLIEYWYTSKLPGSLDIVVRPEFLHIHTDPVNFVSQAQLSTLKIIPITQDEAESLNEGKSSTDRLTRDFLRWQLFCKYASQLSVTCALHLYFDTYKLPLALGAKAPCPFSAIYFRPTFHYDEFTDYVPSWKTKLQAIKEKFILNRVFQHPQLQTLFCLDPFAINQLEKISSHVDVVHLPDPVKLNQQSELTSEQLRLELDIQPERKVLLLFGALNGRKGIYELLDAISQFPDQVCQQICLLLVGGANVEERVRIRSNVSKIRQTLSVQVLERYDFIPEAHVPAYFQLADIVLAPYQRHVGMSGILLLAAAAGKPILSSDYGLMGELVRRYSLGLTVDSTVPDKIGKGLLHFLTEPYNKLCDFSQMQVFAEQHSSEHFAETIFKHLSCFIGNSHFFQTQGVRK